MDRLLVLVRHGQSEWNLKNLFTGWRDVGLTERGVELETNSVRVRDGQTGARPAGAIGFASLRGGSVVGDHIVTLAGEGERIELIHRAESRDIYVRGALRAALWAFDKKPGLYDMSDVLGLH